MTNFFAFGSRAILFDLDGTLVDSALDIAAAVNELTATDRLPPLSVIAVRAMIGKGVHNLVAKAYAAHRIELSDAKLQMRFEKMMAIYPRHLTGRTQLMPGARAAVSACRQAGLSVAVVTNKPQAFSRIIVDHYGLAVDALVGGDSGYPKKPAPDMLVAACALLAVEPQEAIMIGDSINDITSAHAAGIRSIVVSGGYSDIAVENLGADCVLASLDEFVTLSGASRMATTI